MLRPGKPFDARQHRPHKMVQRGEWKLAHAGAAGHDHAAPGGRVKTLLPQRDDVSIMLIHPFLTEELSRLHEQELRRSARRYTPRQPYTRHRLVRRRTGWVLIEIGLALVQSAVTPDTPPHESG